MKSQSTMISLPMNRSNDTSEHFQKKSVSSKEHLFSVESLRRTLSTKSMKISSDSKIYNSSEQDHQYLTKHNKQTLTLLLPENVSD